MSRAIQVVLTNETRGYRISEWIEPLADTYMGEEATMGEIFRASREEYGRCQSKVYLDTANGAKPIGWFFLKRAQYEDTGDTYLQGAWVTVGEHVPAVPEHLTYAEEGS